MTPIEVTQKMLGHLNLTDEEMHQIRDVVDMLADTVVRGYWAQHKELYERLYNGANASGSTGVCEGGVLSDTSRNEQETNS